MVRREFGKYCPIEMSEAVYEGDHVRNLTFYSDALHGRGDVSLHIPPGIEHLERVPMVLMLHGVYGSHWSWFQNGGAHRTALRLAQSGAMRPMMLVCPSDGLAGDGSGYLDSPERAIERWICEDVPGCVRQLYPAATAEGPLFITGLSMGGFGALRLGTKFASLFRAISAHSPITKLSELDDALREPLRLREPAGSGELEILYWARRNRGSLPPIRIDCGTADRLFAANCALHEQLEAEGVSHEFICYRGDHSWAYWREHVAETLLFFEQVLRQG